ncbi:MAG: hypothetical protein ACE5OQ_14410 [Woeseia sp.]
MAEADIVSAARTDRQSVPRGLQQHPSRDTGCACMQQAVDRAAVEPDELEGAIMGYTMRHSN